MINKSFSNELFNRIMDNDVKITRFLNSMNSNRLTDANFFFKWGPNDRVEHNVGHVTA